MEIGIKIFFNILYMSVLASVVACIILLLRKIFDKKISPRWKFAMWFLLFIALIIPFRITIQSNNGEIYTVSSIVDIFENIKNYFIINNTGKIFVYIWLIGMSFLAFIYIVNNFIMNHKIGKKEVQDAHILEIFNKAKENMKVEKNIKLINQEYKKVPCIYGFFNPKILITEEIQNKEDNTLLYIFMHELAHFKRKDTLLNKLLLLVTMIHWFNPILWFCFKKIRQDMELKADELVISKLEKGKEKDYAKSLVSLLQISQEEKQISKVLCVTDGKKNMERRIKMIKLSDKFKEYRLLIGVTTLTLTLCIGMLVFTQIKPKDPENYNTVQYFETPDRIVYKEKEQDKYYVFTSAKQDYTNIVNQLVKCIDGIGEGERLTQEQIKNIEEQENYIELDYDTISKNYIIAYEKEGYNVIKRTDDGGRLIKNNIQYKNELKEVINQEIQNKKEVYSMSDNKEYLVKEEIKLDVNNLFENMMKYEEGVFGVKIQNKQTLDKFMKTYNVKIEEQLQETIFEKVDVIAMISKYDIENITTRVGGITYKFKGQERKDTYIVDVFLASKAINTNCIYRNLGNTTKYSQVIQSTNDVNKNITQTTNKSKTNTANTITKSNRKPITESEAKKIAIKALNNDGIDTYANMKIERKTENKYYLEKWTDTNQNYAIKYAPVSGYEAVDTWYITFQDVGGDPGCYVGVWVSVDTGEVLCYHWTGE